MKPILVQIGSVSIKSWGVMAALGFLMSLTYVYRQAGKKGFSKDMILNLSFYLLISGLIGARLLFVILEVKYYVSRPLEIIMVQQGGLSVHGAFFGGAIATYIFAKYHKISFLKIADLLSPALLLGQGIGRVGCFLGGHCEGKVTSFFIKVKFPMLSGYRHPVQLYEGALNIIAFTLFIFFQDRFKKEGTIFAAVMIVFSLTRFFTDFVRDTEILIFNLSYAQVTSIFFVLIFSIVWFVRSSEKVSD